MGSNPAFSAKETRNWCRFSRMSQCPTGSFFQRKNIVHYGHISRGVYLVSFPTQGMNQQESVSWNSHSAAASRFPFLEMITSRKREKMWDCYPSGLNLRCHAFPVDFFHGVKVHFRSKVEKEFPSIINVIPIPTMHSNTFAFCFQPQIFEITLAFEQE